MRRLQATVLAACLVFPATAHVVAAQEPDLVTSLELCLRATETRDTAPFDGWRAGYGELRWISPDGSSIAGLGMTPYGESSLAYCLVTPVEGIDEAARTGLVARVDADLNDGTAIAPGAAPFLPDTYAAKLAEKQANGAHVGIYCRESGSVFVVEALDTGMLSVSELPFRSETCAKGSE